MKVDIKYLVHIRETSQFTRNMLYVALEQVDAVDCTGVRDANNKHHCVDKLVAKINHTDDTSEIYLISASGERIAYFMNGNFWSAVTKRSVTLV